MDSFGIPDGFLRSALGRYDGNIYESYFEVVKNNRFNATVAPYWDELVKPVVAHQKQQSQQR
jgi:acyl-CoA oxidase